jgi:uncharacterized membrane-anchored protein
MRFSRILAATLLAVLSVMPASGRARLNSSAIATQSDTSADSPASELDQLGWQTSGSGKLGDQATIDVSRGYRFLGAEDTRKFNRLLQNPDSQSDTYTLAPDDLRWIAFFSFSDIGYVKDDEKIDEDALIKSLREGTEAGNEERRKNGWEEMSVTGWAFKPQYDKTSNALEWAILGEGKRNHEKVVNYNTRLLGRKGVMEVVLVGDPAELDASIAEFKTQLSGYAFDSGNRYSEFKAGDHVAEIGLAALVTGGAAAVAAKKGFFAAIAVAVAKLWKLIVLGIVAVGAGFKKFFSRKS